MDLKDMQPPPTEIVYKHMRFLITGWPTQHSMHTYIQELKKHNVKDVVRVCEPTYKIEEFENVGVNVIDLEFDNGTEPTVEIVEEWFELLKRRFREDPECCVAVHCVAGLGRAPVMVALALMELGLKCEDAVDLIRQKRHGAINARQLSYLKKYRPKSRLKLKNAQKNACCLH